MNIIDLVFIFVMIFSAFIGYKRGFMKEVYTTGVLILSILFSYEAQQIIMNNLQSNFTISIEEAGFLNGLLSSIFGDLVLPIIIGFGTFIVIFIFLHLIVFILTNMHILPKKIPVPRIFGSMINVTRNIFFFTFFAFSISLTTMIPDSQYDFYTDSMFMKPLLELNQPLFTFSDNLKSMYDNITDLASLDSPLDDPEKLVDVLIEAKENDFITDDMIVETINIALDQSQEIDLSEIDITSFDEVIKAGEYYDLVKRLYDAEIINENVISEVIDQNNIKGIPVDAVILILE